MCYQIIKLKMKRIDSLLCAVRTDENQGTGVIFDGTHDKHKIMEAIDLEKRELAEKIFAKRQQVEFERNNIEFSIASSAENR